MSGGGTGSLPFFTAEDVVRRLPFSAAMDAIEAALRAEPAAGGVDPELDGPRLFSPTPQGEFLMMPAQSGRFCGIKALTIAPGNPDRGLEKIQGLYLLYSTETSAPIAVMEGASLTAIRTPAVAVSAIRQLAALAPAGDELPAEPKVLVFGAGVQAEAFIRTLAGQWPDATFGVVGRRPEKVAAMIASLAEAPETTGRTIKSQAERADAAVAEADIIVCATSASSPVFDGSLVRGGAIVAAVGTHGRELREVDDQLVSRADIVVEGRGSAQRENGNLVSLSDAVWQGEHRPANLRELARGEVARTAGRPAFYTGVGMSWEDLVCATAVFDNGGASA